MFYNGPSVLNGQPVIGVLTGLGANRSSNSKTGDMVQAWVLTRDVSPVDAVKTGQDDAICGNCPMRSGSNVGRACYVIWWLAPQKIWQTFHAGRIPQVPASLASTFLLGEAVRVTAYGDAAAIPFDVWAGLIGRAKHHTGYTSQWETCDPRFKLLLMASVHSPADGDKAARMGWRTFREGWDRAYDWEVQCPASAEMGHRTTCQECNLCQGTSKQAKSVAIVPHGQRTKWIPGVPQ